MTQKENNATVAILDDQFHLHTFLGAKPGVRTYRATHISGREVAVKLISDPATFFDSLARLYAVDYSPYFARCLYNYPPASASGLVPPLAPAACELMPDQPQEHLGVLVIEWVEGEPLNKALADADEMEKVDGLLELSFALRALHKVGICHGSLKPGNVFFDGETGELRMIGLGADPQWWKEADDVAMARGICEDTHLMAKHFLDLPRKTGFAFRKFRRACLHQDYRRRPNLEVMQQQIRKLRSLNTPRRSLEILFGFLKPMHVFSWFLVIFLASHFMSRLMGDGDAPFQKQRAAILENKKTTGPDRVQQLRQLYGISEDPIFRDYLADDISQYTVENVVVLSPEDAARPIAVLAFKNEPAVVGRHHLIRIGDWVEVADRFGYVAAIEYNRIKIVHEDAYSWHLFERPRNFQGLILGTEVVVVWNNENNLDRLLEGCAELFSLTYIHKKPIGESGYSSLAGKVSGIFPAKGGFDSFLTELHETIDVTVQGSDLVYRHVATEVPVYYKAFAIILEGRTLGSITSSIERILGIPVRINPELLQEKVSIKLYNVTWKEILESLDLTYTLVNEGNQPVLLLEKRGNI